MAQAQSIFIPKASNADLAALDYFTAWDFVFNASSGVATQRNNHSLATFPPGDTNGYFAGVMGEDYDGVAIAVSLFWVAPAIVGDVVWFVSWERDNALPGGANVDVDSYAAAKAVVSAAPGVTGEIQKATILFTAAEADGIVGGDPYRLRIRRDSGVLSDTMPGEAQLFRVSLMGT